MSYSLKLTGLATDLVMCLAMDEDGSTIREFVSSTVNSNKTVDAGVTTGSATWKGVSRGWFQTLPNGASFDGIRFAVSFRPQVDLGNLSSAACFIACAGISARNGDGGLVAYSLGKLFGRSESGPESFGSPWHVGTTAMPTDGTTKFSAGINHEAFVDYSAFYGLESGSLAADGSGADGGFGNDNTDITAVGGSDSNIGNQPGKYFLVAVFDRELTLAEYQSLHDDWFGTLFTGGGGSAAPTLRIVQGGLRW
jgi:hypothetical protein